MATSARRPRLDPLQAQRPQVRPLRRHQGADVGDLDGNSLDIFLGIISSNFKISSVVLT